MVKRPVGMEADSRVCLVLESCSKAPFASRLAVGLSRTFKGAWKFVDPSTEIIANCSPLLFCISTEASEARVQRQFDKH